MATKIKIATKKREYIYVFSSNYASEDHINISEPVKSFKLSELNDLMIDNMINIINHQIIY